MGVTPVAAGPVAGVRQVAAAVGHAVRQVPVRARRAAFANLVRHFERLMGNDVTEFATS